MNRISLAKLKEIIGIKEYKNIKDDSYFSIFRIVKGQKLENNPEETICFPITIKEKDNGGGWYQKDSDTREKVNFWIEENPDLTYVIEESMLSKIENKEVKLIIVDNIMDSIDKLFNYILSIRNFKTILVTGSVGKTSTVGLIEKVISSNCLRIYSKRITPIILKHHIINFLTDNIEYLVLEAGLFYRHHVSYFSETLHPEYSICLNALPEHLGIDNIKSVKDIVIGKLEIFKYCKYAYINKKDPELSKVIFKDKKIYYEDFEMSTKIENIIDISKLEIDIPLYIKTNLSKIQYSAAYEIGKTLNIPNDKIIKRLKDSTPIENRTNKKMIDDKEVIFDGDVSGVVRFSLFTDHFYDNAVLVIRALTYGGEEDEDYSKIIPFFDRFNKVYIFEEINNLINFKHPKIELVKDHKFLKEIPEDTAIFYHYGSYYRHYDEFSKENLERPII